MPLQARVDREGTALVVHRAQKLDVYNIFPQAEVRAVIPPFVSERTHRSQRVRVAFVGRRSQHTCCDEHQKPQPWHKKNPNPGARWYLEHIAMVEETREKEGHHQWLCTVVIVHRTFFCMRGTRVGVIFYRYTHAGLQRQKSWRFCAELDQFFLHLRTGLEIKQSNTGEKGSMKTLTCHHRPIDGLYMVDAR